MKNQDEQVQTSWLVDQASATWKQNHASWLLIFSVVVFLIGSGLIAYQQMQFKPLEFPSNLQNVQAGTSETIEDVEDLEDYVLFLVDGAASDQGQMRMALFADSAKFPDLSEAFDRVSNDIERGRSVLPIALETLPEKFAILVFHDENLDSVMNRDSQGVPTERYGINGGFRIEDQLGDPSPPLMERPPAGAEIVVPIR